jgi:hypothetical protein
MRWVNETFPPRASLEVVINNECDYRSLTLQELRALMLQLELREMLPCSERREQILREWVQELMHLVSLTLGSVWQQAAQALSVLQRRYEQLVVVSVPVQLGLLELQHLLAEPLAEQAYLLPEDYFRFGQALKYLVVLQLLVLEEFHLWVSESELHLIADYFESR